MQFDSTDVYDAAALYCLWYDCQCCGRRFDFKAGARLSLDEYHLMAQEAKRRGWLVAEMAVPAKQSEELSYKVLCPFCAHLAPYRADGLSTPGYRRVIDGICDHIRIHHGLGQGVGDVGVKSVSKSKGLRFLNPS